HEQSDTERRTWWQVTATRKSHDPAEREIVAYGKRLVAEPLKRDLGIGVVGCRVLPAGRSHFGSLARRARFERGAKGQSSAPVLVLNDRPASRRVAASPAL